MMCYHENKLCNSTNEYRWKKQENNEYSILQFAEAEYKHVNLTWKHGHQPAYPRIPALSQDKTEHLKVFKIPKATN